jgi:hypothetical protein
LPEAVERGNLIVLIRISRREGKVSAKVGIQEIQSEANWQKPNAERDFISHASTFLAMNIASTIEAAIHSQTLRQGLHISV